MSLLACCIAPQEKDYPIQLTNWQEAQTQIGSPGRIEGSLFAKESTFSVVLPSTSFNLAAKVLLKVLSVVHFVHQTW